MLNEKVMDIKESLIRKISDEAKKYPKVLNLTVGEPDIPTPLKITEYCIEKMKKNKVVYSPTGGLIELREEVTKYFNGKYQCDFDFENALICSGSTEALASTLKTLINLNDEIIVPIPAYPGYEPLINLAGGKTVFLNTELNNFKISVELIEKVITDRTKGIILNYPNNPTGVCLNKNEIYKIVQFCKKKNIYIISDEVYEGLAYYDSVSFTSYFEEYKKIIVISGFSKSHSMTGYRIGYLLGDKEIVEKIKKVSQFNVTSPNLIGQWGGIIALKEFSNTDESTNIYRKRFLYLKRKLEEIEIKVVESFGGIYLYFKNPMENISTFDFVMKFLQDEKIALVPGEAFKNQGYVRVSLIQDIPELKIFFKKIKNFVDKE